MRKPLFPISHRTTTKSAHSKQERFVKLEKRDRVTKKPKRASTK